MTILTHLIAAFIRGGVGYWLHYKYGSTVAALEAKVKSVV